MQNLKRLPWLTAAFLALAFFIHIDTQAQTNTWQGGASGFWNVPGNWTLNAVPGITGNTGHNVVINNGASITMDVTSAIQVNSITTNSGFSTINIISDREIRTNNVTVTGILRLAYVNSSASPTNILNIYNTLTLTNGIIARLSTYTATDVNISVGRTTTNPATGTISMNDISTSYIANNVVTNVVRKNSLASDVRFEGDVNLPAGLTLGNYDLYLGIDAEALTPNAVVGDPGNCIEVSGTNSTPAGTVRKQYSDVNDEYTFNISPGTDRMCPITIKVVSPTTLAAFGTATPWPHFSVRVVLNSGGQGGHPENQQQQKVWVHWPVECVGINEPVYLSGSMTFHNNYRNGSASDLYSARYTPLYEVIGTGGGWDLVGSVQVTNTSGDIRTVPFNGFPGCGDFTVGNGTPATDPVPVELTAFSARYMDGMVRLNWQTATELNNFGFAIERSQDGEGWEEVGFVPGFGNSSSPKSYAFEDVLDGDLLRVPQLAYRLRQMDRDGTTDYSNIVFVTTGELPERVELYAAYPNPFNPTTTISFAIKNAANVTLKVYNTFGQEVATLLANSTMDAGLHTVPFNGDQLPSGVYMAVLEADGALQQQKLVLNK